MSKLKNNKETGMRKFGHPNNKKKKEQRVG